MVTAELLQPLDSIRRRARRLALGYGVGIVLASAAGVVVALALVDYLFNLPAWPRFVATLVAVAALVFASARFLWTPARSAIGLADVAGKVETAFPAFEDRLRSVVEYSDREIPGSEAMKRHVVAQAAQIARGVDFAEVLAAKPAVLSLGGGLVATMAVLLLALTVMPAYARVAMARILSPFDENPWPKRQRIDLVAAPRDRVVAGSRFDLQMKLGQGDRRGLKAIVYSQAGDGPVQQQLMERTPDGVYSAAVDTPAASADLTRPLKVWIRAGDDELTIPPIALVQPLLLSSVTARISPPPYVQDVAPSTTNLASSTPVVSVGSTVELEVAFNKPIVGAVALEPVEGSDGGRDPMSPATQPAGVVGGEDQSGPVRRLLFSAEKSMKFRVRARDADDFTNTGVEQFEIVVRPDQLPGIQIESPRGAEERTVEAVIPLVAVAEDDFGIEQVDLVVERVADHKNWSFPLVGNTRPVDGVSWLRDSTTADRQRYRLGYEFALGLLGPGELKPGDVLEVYLRATDNFVLATSAGSQRHEPQASGRIRITIISQDDLTNRVMDELRVVRGQLGEIARAQARLRNETVDLNEESEAAERLNEAQRATASRLANQQSTAAAQSRQLARRLEGAQQRLEQNRSPRQDLGDLAKQVAQGLDRTAEGAMKEAAQRLSSTAQPAVPKDPRNAALKQAEENQQNAGRQLQNAMDQLGDLGSLQQTIDAVNSILAEQKKLSEELADIGKTNIGKRPEQMTAGDRQKLNDVADRQGKLADRTSKAIADMQKQAEQLARTDPQSAEAMRQAAQSGQQQQVSPNQQKASQAAKQNQQSGAQQAQKQAELGLQQMLENLKDAETRKLAELQKQLADLQKQVDNLVRRQAGHNLDNLSLQGPDRLGKLDPKDTAELILRSQRKPNALPPVPTVQQLSSAQEQTERNTRDIATQSDGLPNLADAVARLTRAAGRMERANVHIRQNDLPAAYDPPQVEALSALMDAKRLVDEQKQKVDEKVEQQKREAIRAVYTRVREAQARLNAETSRIDTAPRKDDGALKREDLIKLGQLPTEQGKLVDEIKAVDERLGKLGSVVYVWANADIARTMDEIKVMLAAQQTGKATQVEQMRVIRQLDQMIDSLQENPIQSKFAQDAGGGGGGGKQQGSRLPDEAELRLLKGLQGAVNDATSQLAGEDKKDAAAVQSLGNRQGQLRQLLNDLLEKSSKGELTLGPEPDNRDQLPEEAGDEAVDNQELDADLLKGAEAAEAEQKKVERVGARMGRVRQRLAINVDPGKTTQTIQKKVLDDLDLLIEQARRQQAQTRNSDPNSQPSETETKGQPKPGDQAQGENQGAQQQANADQAAKESNAGGGLGKTGKAGAELKETLREWGSLSPRQREAIIEGSGENVIEAYKKLVDDYYKALSTKATEK